VALLTPHCSSIFIIYFHRLIIAFRNGFCLRENELMRTLFIGALCATLIGCSCPVPQRGVVETCASQGCFSRTAATTPIEQKRAPFRPEPKITTAKSKKVATAAKAADAKPRNETEPVRDRADSRTMTEPEVTSSAQSLATSNPVSGNAATTIGRKTDSPATGQPSETSDPVLEKAKMTVAAKMENPAFAEFVDMKLMREHKFGQSFEVICGHVKGKKKSGQSTGERPFLYLVKEEEAFIVGGNRASMAAIAYRAHCTSPNSH
jgi:hypothetical protein